MHIGINAQLLSFSQNYRNGGVSRYIRYLLTELAKRPGEHQYSVFVNGKEVVEKLAAHHPQITYISAPWSEEKPAARVAWEQLTLPGLIRQRHIDVFHSPVNVLPARLPTHCATVITLHDLAFLRYPEVLTRAKRLYHSTFTVHSLRQATRLITVSESTRKDANTLVGIPLERIQTVYPCIDESFSNVLTEEQIKMFRQQKGLNDGYILYMGTLEPRKNLPILIEAYAQLRQNSQVREKLVLAGGKGWMYEEIFEKVRQCGMEADVLFPGFVADSEQLLWYAAAAAFAYPALYEGFGLPVAEALACGIPTVTSNVSSLPEAGAGVALCVDPHNVQELSKALDKALNDAPFRQQCQRMASPIAQRFSAATMLEHTKTVYEQAAQSMHTGRSHYISSIQ